MPPRSRSSPIPSRRISTACPTARSCPFRHDQQHAAGDDCGDAGPERDVDRPLFLHRQVEAADLQLVTFLRIAEFPVRESGDAGHDQKDGDDPETTHDQSLRPDRRPVKRRTTKSRSTAPMNATIRLPTSPPPSSAPTARKSQAPTNAPMTPTTMSPRRPKP